MLLPIGTQVVHSGHGPGTIVAYNGQPSGANEYPMSSRGIPVLNEVLQRVPELAAGIVNSFYDSETYPYVVLYDSGHQDVYNSHEFIVVEED